MSEILGHELLVGLIVFILLYSFYWDYRDNRRDKIFKKLDTIQVEVEKKRLAKMRDDVAAMDEFRKDG